MNETVTSIIAVGLGVAAMMEFSPAQTEAFMRIGWRESEYRNVRVGDDCGPWQVNIKHWPVAEWQHKTDDPMDIVASTYQAGYIFKWLLDRYEMHVYTAAGAYTMGFGAVDGMLEAAEESNWLWMGKYPEPYETYALFVTCGVKCELDVLAASTPWTWRDAMRAELTKE